MSRDIAIAVGLGALSALCLLSVAAGSVGAVILTYMAPLPLFVVGLVFGLPKLLLAAVVGSAGTMFLGVTTLVTYGLAVALPVLLLCRQALLARTLPDGRVEWYPPGLLLTWLTGIAAFYLVVATIWFSGEPGGLPGRLQPQLRQALGEFSDSEAPDQFAEALAQAMPAVMGSIWMLVTALNGMLAQGVAVRFDRNIRPSPSLAEVELPQFLTLALAGALAGSFLPGTAGFLSESLAVIVAVPFFFQGLGVVHVLARKTSMPALVLVGFYVMLLLFGGLVVVIAALGLIEQWARWRRRLTGPGGGQEDE